MASRLGCVLAAMFVCSASLATPNRWTSIGPFGGNVGSIAVHPSDPNTVWVTVNPGGLFRSRDGGSNWQRLSVGELPGGERAAFAVVVDPGNPAFLLAAAGSFGEVSRSDDGGETWTAAARPGINRIQALAIAPGSSSVAFAATQDGLYRSVDRGVSWTLVFAVPNASGSGLVLKGVQSIAVDPTNPRVVYAAGIAAGFLKSTDGGLTFASNTGPAFAASIAVDPSRPSVLYAAQPAFGAGVRRSSDGGATWISANSGLTDTNARSIAVDPGVSDRVWVACDGGGIFRSSDGAGSWAPVAAGLTNPFGNAIVFGAGGAAAYAGFTGAGVFRSADHGASWSTTNIPAAQPQKLAWSGASLVAGIYGVGLARTGDRGRPEFYDLAVSRRDPRNVAVGTFGAIYSSRDGGTTWTTFPVSNSSCQSVTYDAQDASTIYASLLPPGILRSRDAGATWTMVSDLATEARGDYANIIRADAANSGVVFAGTTGSGLLRSTDGGQSWQRTSYSGHYALALEFDALDPRRIYATDGGAFFRSADDGLTWTSGGPIQGGMIALASVPGRAGAVYAAASSTGVLQTADFGETWTPVNSGLPTFDVTAIQVDPADPSRVYVGTNGFGVFAIDRTGSPAGPCVRDGSTLCLNGDRFRVSADWRVPSQGTAGAGTAVRLTGDTGYFWFFSANNVELVVKLVDGTPVNDKYWFFSGALSDVEYQITVLDTVTGESKTYSNPSGTLASLADTSAF